MGFAFFELAKHLVELDLFWFIGFALDNLLWVFMLACLAYFMVGKDKVFWGTIFLYVAITITMGFTNVLGWPLLTAGFLSVHYIVRLTMLTFMENVKALKPFLLPATSVQLYVTLWLYTVFMGA